VPIRVHSWFKTIPSFVSIRVHSWFKTTPHSCPFVSIRGLKPSPHSCPFVSIRGLKPSLHSCPFVFIRGSKPPPPFVSIRGSEPPLSVHPWFAPRPAGTGSRHAVRGYRLQTEGTGRPEPPGGLQGCHWNSGYLEEDLPHKNTNSLSARLCVARGFPILVQECVPPFWGTYVCTLG